MTPDYIASYVMPAAYALLPERMASTRATAMTIACGWQESKYTARTQQPTGPARGFWQFELIGVLGVLEHPRTGDVLRQVLRLLAYDDPMRASDLHQALAHNDVLAACVARLLLWRSPMALPYADEADYAWAMYLDSWKPGKPRAAAWPSSFKEGWEVALRQAPSPGLSAYRLGPSGTSAQGKGQG